MKTINRAAGFTLIEAMITLTILAILMAIVAPAMTNLLNSNRLTTHTGALKQAIQYARSEAVSKNQPVSICASSNGASCTGTWDQGWIVFTDADDSRSVNGTDTVLRVWNGISDNFDVAGQSMTFSSTGERTSPAGAVISFQVNDPTDSNADDHARTLSINNVGWVTISKGGS